MSQLWVETSKVLGKLRPVLEEVRRLSRRHWKVLLAGLGVCAVIGGFSFGPVVRWRAQAEAERRGLALTIESLGPAWDGVWLRGVRVAPLGIEGLSAELASVHVGLTLGLSLDELSVHGGSVRLTGTVDELSRKLEDWRKRRGLRSGSARASQTRISVEGIDASWSGLTAEPSYVWGARFERGEDGSERASFDRIRAPLGAARVESKNVVISARRNGEQRVLERLTADGVDATVVIDDGPRVVEPARAAPASSSKNAQKAPAKAADEPRFEPDSTRGPKLRALFGIAASALGESLPAGGALTLAGLRVKLLRAGEVLNIGPSELRVERSGDAADIALVPGAQADRGATPLSLRARLPFAQSAVGFELEGGPVSLASLGIQDGNFGLAGVAQATIEARAKATLSADGTVVGFSGSGKLDRLSLNRAELAPRPLSGIRLAFSARGDATLDGSRLRIEEGELRVGEVRARAELDVARSSDGSTARAKGGVPLASCQALLDALPEGLAPRLSSVRLAGTLALEAELAFDSRVPADTRVRLAVKNECRVSELPGELSPKRFFAPWIREVRGADSLPMQVESGPGTPTWIPYDGISPFMETAVLVCEDGRFPHHRGFDFRAVENSIKDNLKAGRFVRGASTLSMQLAKNLYLGQEKTLSRKLQEAVFTILLEQELSKTELLELYLNVVEFGPGIYGIGPAAHHYFAKHPRDLSLGQALYLASILPNPDAHHFRPDGELNPGWSSYLKRLMQIAHDRKRINDEELEAGLSEQIAFRSPGDVQHAPPPPGSLEDETPPELPGSPSGALGQRALQN